MKLSKNSPCPCGSGKKYKFCCLLYHKGKIAATPLELMRSRYSAYAAGQWRYILKTTHPSSPYYQENHQKWKEEILEFSKSRFKKLEIISYDNDAGIVEFRAHIDEYVLHEKSYFKKDPHWLYYKGEVDVHQ